MLDSLHIKNFRCFEDLTIPSLGRVNLIVGKNNSGKSTLLDAIYLYANSGNIWAIQRILAERNEFPHVDTKQTNDFFSLQPDTQSRNAFESLSNIFLRKKNVVDCSIEAKESSGEIIQIQLEKTKDIEKTKESHGIPKAAPLVYPIVASSQAPTTLSPLPQEGFLVVKRIVNDQHTYHIPSTPYTIKNDLAMITPSIPITTIHPVKAFIYNENELADIWSRLNDAGEDVHINEALRIIDPSIYKAYYTVDGKVAKVRGDDNGAQTLKSLGDGMSRIFQIFILAYATKGGILTIDEIENGLHYSIQEGVWGKLFKLAKELDIQVFVTTHSEDTIKAFCKVAVADEDVDGKLISLARSAKTSNKGQIFAITYEEEKLETFIEMGMEVRG